MTQLPPLSDLSRLSHAEKDTLIRALWTRVNEGLARVEELTARVAALEAKLGEAPKTPDNSSTPPSRGHKPNKPPHRKGRRKRPGTARQLNPDPDRIIEAKAATCPRCSAGLGDTDQTLQPVYDRIEFRVEEGRGG